MSIRRNLSWFATKDGYIFVKYRYNKFLPIAGQLPSRLNPDGYVRVKLYNDSIFVHRLVWLYFNGVIPTGLEINHKDANKQNNALDNLELVTRGENMAHAKNLQLCPGSSHKRIYCNETKMAYPSLRAAARILNLSHGNISRHLAGELKAVNGFSFHQGQHENK